LRMQVLGSNAQVPIIDSGASGYSVLESSVSPDSKWIVFLLSPQDNLTVNTTVQLMRVPISGGNPQPIFSMRGGSSFSCARPPGKVCTVAEETQDRKTMIVSSFDAVKGRGTELARFPLVYAPSISPLDYAPTNNASVQHPLLSSISPDGTRLAVAPGESGPITIYSLWTNHRLVISRKTSQALKDMKAINWTADGKGLIVSTDSNRGGEVFHLDFQGNANSLWTCASFCVGIPSPDGRHVSIYNQTVSANMWMMENF